ncbi:hypothetical protein [Acaryochloris marina]|uniref:hypothetical protein n=1 Tax=Acaryochloris marina TaxID=155978 RepID=UPI001BAE91D6|nr:hypothetical protein [Acaryochloris marina]QUY45547.1 hypothetical protein I1H34_27720 [Acaryochloris marina S15]
MTASTPESNNPIEQALTTMSGQIQELTTKVEALDKDVRAANERTDTYWEASKLLINLAFGLIATAVIAIIVPAVLR